MADSRAKTPESDQGMEGWPPPSRGLLCAAAGCGPGAWRDGVAGVAQGAGLLSGPAALRHGLELASLALEEEAARRGASSGGRGHGRLCRGGGGGGGGG